MCRMLGSAIIWVFRNSGGTSLRTKVEPVDILHRQPQVTARHLLIYGIHKLTILDNKKQCNDRNENEASDNNTDASE